MRRRVISPLRSRSKLTHYNLSNDKMSDIKKFYGWSERQLEQNVRERIDSNNRQIIENEYHKVYGKKD